MYFFPYTQKHSPYCGITGTRLFPKDYSMQADNIGNKDFMAVVVSKKPIDFNELNNKINSSIGNSYLTKITETLKNQIVQNVSFKSSDRIEFETDVNDKNSVAIIIEVDKK